MSVILILLLQAISFVFIARAILSWFPVGPEAALYPVVNTLDRVTEPVLRPIRRVLPRLGPFDISTLVVIVAINLALMPLASRL